MENLKNMNLKANLGMVNIEMMNHLNDLEIHSQIHLQIRIF